MTEREKELFKLALKVCQIAGRTKTFYDCPHLEKVHSEIDIMRKNLNANYTKEVCDHMRKTDDLPPRKPGLFVDIDHVLARKRKGKLYTDISRDED